MSNELEKVEKSIVKVVDEKTIRDFLFTSETKLNNKQQNMFLQIAIRHNLDPFKREVYAIAYGNEFSIVTGYQVYIERAEASGKLDGWSCENTEEGAKITIHRNDWAHPFEWEATYAEFDKGQSSWKKMRQFMIKKVCIGQGFRLAFPAELGGMPYLREEMEGAKPFDNKKSPVKKTESKSKSKAKAGAKVTTGVAKITQSEATNRQTGHKFPVYKILGQSDVIYNTSDESLATLARSAHEAGCDIVITHKDDAYNTIENIELVEDGA